MSRLKLEVTKVDLEISEYLITMVDGSVYKKTVEGSIRVSNGRCYVKPASDYMDYIFMENSISTDKDVELNTKKVVSIEIKKTKPKIAVISVAKKLSSWGNSTIEFEYHVEYL